MLLGSKNSNRSRPTVVGLTGIDTSQLHRASTLHAQRGSWGTLPLGGLIILEIIPWEPEDLGVRLLRTLAARLILEPV